MKRPISQGNLTAIGVVVLQHSRTGRVRCHGRDLIGPPHPRHGAHRRDFQRQTESQDDGGTAAIVEKSGRHDGAGEGRRPHRGLEQHRRRRILKQAGQRPGQIDHGRQPVRDARHPIANIEDERPAIDGSDGCGHQETDEECRQAHSACSDAFRPRKPIGRGHRHQRRDRHVISRRRRRAAPP